MIGYNDAHYDSAAEPKKRIYNKREGEAVNYSQTRKIAAGKLGRYLTKRYVLAVALIALLACGAYISLSALISSQEVSAVLINVSGRQRMLSQRIGLYSAQLAMREGEAREDVRKTLEELIAEMRTAHEGLTQGSARLGLSTVLSPTVREMYFAPPVNLDARVRHYLQLAETLAQNAEGGIRKDNPVLVELLEISPALVSSLNDMVKQYENEARANAVSLQRLELGILLATLLALVAEVLFIFRPMVQNVVRLSSKIDEKELMLSTFVQHTPAAVAMFDKEVRYIAASDRWFKDYGIIGKDVIGRSHYDVFPEIIKHHPEWMELHQRTIKGEVIARDEELFLRESGEKEWLRYELHPWQEADGSNGGLIMFTENITERKQVEIMKDEFISTVNHELRTPLTSIQMSIGLLRGTAMDAMDSEGKKLVTLAYDNCDRLIHLVNDILDMEKIAAGKMDYKMRPVEMCKLVKDIIERHSSYAGKYQVEFVLKLQEEPVYCYLDSSRFNQALVNLISNASKFSPPGETVVISVERESGNRVRVAVADHGAGIPKAFRSKIFGKFAQADSSNTRNKGGTGLGLNITKSIIEAFDGKIGFDSEEGQGTTFYFLLPVTEERPAEEVAA